MDVQHAEDLTRSINTKANELDPTRANKDHMRLH